MPSKTENLEDLAGDVPISIDPYEVLSLDKDATEDQVKKAYRKAALKHHPDKATAENAATAKEDFQKIAFAYAILSDERRRKRYDATGSTSDSVDIDDDDFDWSSFFREQYQAITKESISQFISSYQESGEERQAVLDAYTKGKGNMDRVYETVMASNVLDDDARFRGIIDAAIEGGEVEAYPKYIEETDKSKERRIKKAEREAKEAEEEMEKMEKKAAAKKGKPTGKKANKEDDLAALIQQRGKARGASFLDALEEKYSKMEREKASGKKRAAMDEPPEEAFAAVGQRLKKARSRK